MEIKNKMNDLNNNYNDEEQPEENNYMEDGELDDNEEHQIEQQLEQEEQPEITGGRKVSAQNSISYIYSTHKHFNIIFFTLMSNTIDT